VSDEQGAREGAAGGEGPEPQGPEAEGRGTDKEREEIHRQAAIAASAPLMLLCAPFFAPIGPEESILQAAWREPAVLAIAGLVMLWPFGLGAVSLWRGLRRRAPGKVGFGVPAVVEVLATGGLSLLIVLLMADERRIREQPLVWLGALAGVAAVYLTARGFRRDGWTRWVQLLAGAWLFYVQGALLLAGAGAPFFSWPELGAWLFLFALSALAPLFAWALWPRAPINREN
jgi:hypothetical protein